MEVRDWPLRLVQLLAVPGLLVSYYLFLYHQEVVSYVCEADSFFDCSRVSGPTSPYSTIGELPIATLGLVGYGLIFVVIWLRPFNATARRYGGEITFALTTIGLLFTLYLKGLELFVIHALCEYCLYSAVIIVAMFVLSTIHLLRSRRRGGGRLDSGILSDFSSDGEEVGGRRRPG